MLPFLTLRARAVYIAQSRGKNRDAPEQKRNVLPVLLSFGEGLLRRKKLAEETTYLESLNK